MYFPFFATEVKSGTSGLVIADRLNGHMMGIVIRGILSLYRLAGKESQLYNKPAAFRCHTITEYIAQSPHWCRPPIVSQWVLDWRLAHLCE
jgi:hypothetical protein